MSNVSVSPDSDVLFSGTQNLPTDVSLDKQDVRFITVMKDLGEALLHNDAIFMWTKKVI